MIKESVVMSKLIMVDGLPRLTYFTSMMELQTIDRRPRYDNSPNLPVPGLFDLKSLNRVIARSVQCMGLSGYKTNSSSIYFIGHKPTVTELSDA